MKGAKGIEGSWEGRVRIEREWLTSWSGSQEIGRRASELAEERKDEQREGEDEEVEKKAE